MSIEHELARIATALEKLVGGPGTEVVPVALAQVEVPKRVKAVKVAEKVEPKTAENELFDDAPEANTKAVVTEEAVREIVKKYAETESPEKAMELLKKFKVKRLRELKPEQYAEVVEVFSEALA